LSTDQSTPASSDPPIGIDFRRLAESVADVLLQVDADGVIEWASQGTASTVGCGAAALPGRPCLSVVHPDSRAVFASATRAALAQGRSQTTAMMGSQTAGWAWQSVVLRRMATEAGYRVIVSGRAVEPQPVADTDTSRHLPTGQSLAHPRNRARPIARKQTVLLIDDEPLVRAMAARMLRDLGYEVVQASGAGAALALTDEELANVSVLMSDVVMPGIGGLQLAAMLDERQPGLPTLFMSGYVPAAGVEAAFHRTATGFLTKPFGRVELAAALDTVLGASTAPAPAGR
jgi:CheY-like chemotaxis protein